MLDGENDRNDLLATPATLHVRGRPRLPEELLEAVTAGEILDKQLGQALRFMARAAGVEKAAMALYGLV